MKLFIIGNGFDLGHKLKTSYWDFRTFLENNYPDFLREFESYYNIYPGFSDSEKKGLLWNEFESNLANIGEDVIVENATSIDMGLESGDIGIEDTLYEYFSEQFNYIDKLQKYLRYWIQSIRIRDVLPQSKLINSKSDDMYVSFNYTGVLENTYKITEDKIIHIHGSLRQRGGDPVIGHGSYGKIISIQHRHEKATEIFDEKESSIARVIENYYNKTYKNINKYMIKLYKLRNRNIDEIIIIGHSLSGVDMPYFRVINSYAHKNTKWIVYYYDNNRKEEMLKNLRECGVLKKQIKLEHSDRFYNV